MTAPRSPPAALGWEACGISYGKDLAPRLGVRPPAISNYRKGISHPDAMVCATLAGLTGVPLTRVLGVFAEARAISREEKAVWRKLAATALALCLAVGLPCPIRHMQQPQDLRARMLYTYAQWCIRRIWASSFPHGNDWSLAT